ncbi:MAG: Gfo/Idh/MocA family oxidoreductase [Pseudomonadota bacterium]|nr:Gfo/Idh/MocA family oxidoreductase [Pseudomonadota bacterium]
MTINIAIVGLGKIARDQHLPALAANDAFRLVAIASPHNTLDGLPCYPSLQQLLEAQSGIDAIALCTTPQVRYDAALYALRHGCHVLLEKPPGVTVSEVLSLADVARENQLTLFASWHSRHARAVEPARRWLADRRILGVTINWKEDVRVWHPGQKWIWEAGGLGVFDPGINALSILTRIIPGSILLKDAELAFPANCATPIAAQLHLQCADGALVRVNLDFLQTGLQTWDIEVETDAGRLTLSLGGTRLFADAKPVGIAPSEEYPNLYEHFAGLVREHRIDVDVAPLQLVADAFLCGRRVEVAPFIE